MFNLHLVAVGTLKNKELLNLAQEYQKRIKPFARLQITEIAAASFSDKTKEAAKKMEADKIRSFLAKKTEANIILLDEGGQEYNSLTFANFLEYQDREIIFLIGGALGWEENLRNSFPRLSLSQLTMPHELARVMLLEQIYRAVLIKSGKRYHY